MNFQHLLAFETTADLGGITKAAQILDLSPAALSARHKKFETSLGIKLFTHQKSFALTSDGLRFLEYVRPVLASYRQMLIRLVQSQNQNENKIETPASAFDVSTEQLYEFLILSNVLNFSKAAERLYISQSALSRHLEALEKAFGQPLMIRDTHTVKLTKAGEILAEHSPDLIEQCARTMRLMRYSRQTFDGHILIACAPEIAYAAHVRSTLEAFMHRYPSIHVELDVRSEGTPVTLLEEYDIVLTPCDYPIYPETVQRRLLFSHRTFAVVNTSHRLNGRKSIHLRDLSGETIIVPFFDELFGPYAANWILAEKYTHGRVNHIPAANLSTALMQAVLNKGLLIAPGYVGNVLPKGLCMIEINSLESRFEEYIYYNNSRQNHAAQLFYDEIGQMTV